MSHFLDGIEFENVLNLRKSLASNPDVKPIVDKLQCMQAWVEQRDSLKPDSEERKHAWKPVEAARPAMFELRFAYELVRRDIPFVHERKTLANSSVDFYVPGPIPWLIELACSSDSVDVARSKKVDGLNPLITTSSFDSSKYPAEPSPQQELLRIQGKVKEKVWDRRKKAPIKFPELDNTYRAIVFDVRGFESGYPPDVHDMRQLAFGAHDLMKTSGGIYAATFPKAVLNEMGELITEHVLLTGLFDEYTDGQDAALLRERVHLIIFVADKVRSLDDFVAGCTVCINPFLANSMDAAYKSFPLSILDMLARHDE